MFCEVYELHFVFIVMIVFDFDILVWLALWVVLI